MYTNVKVCVQNKHFLAVINHVVSVKNIYIHSVSN